jgi:hypothetical protein
MLHRVALVRTETSVLTRATGSNIPEDIILHIHRRKTLKSYDKVYFIVTTFHSSYDRRAMGHNLASTTWNLREKNTWVIKYCHFTKYCYISGNKDWREICMFKQSINVCALRHPVKAPASLPSPCCFRQNADTICSRTWWFAMTRRAVQCSLQGTLLFNSEAESRSSQPSRNTLDPQSTQCGTRDSVHLK